MASAWGLREADWERIGGPAISFFVFGVLELLAIVHYHGTVQWDDWQLYALIALIASYLVLGAESSRARQPASATAAVTT